MGEGWIVEVDGLPPSNSSLAEHPERYDTFGEPIMCCEVKSPPMGETAKLDVFIGLLGGVIIALVIWRISEWLEWRR